MKPETAAYLEKADQALDKARRVLGIGIADEAGRHAYYAQFHAAQAMIFERTSKIAKSHKGVSHQFHRLTKTEPRLTPQLAASLSASYHFKEVADYETGPVAMIAVADASEAIAAAEAFVSSVRTAIAATVR